MHEEIGIAADRRREVQVVGRREAEVADVDHVVHRLAQRAQEQEVERALHRLAVQRREEVLELARRAAGLGVEVDAERVRQLGELLQALVGGHVVDAPHRVELALAEVARDGFVGREHEVLDELVGALDRGVAARLHDVAHALGIVLVEDDLGLGQLEVERAALEAARAQLLGERRHALELGQELACSARARRGSRRRARRRRPGSRAAPCELMTAAQKYSSCTSPAGSISMRATIAQRSTSGLSEQIPDDSWCGSIGIARSGR